MTEQRAADVSSRREGHSGLWWEFHPERRHGLTVCLREGLISQQADVMAVVVWAKRRYVHMREYVHLAVRKLIGNRWPAVVLYVPLLFAFDQSYIGKPGRRCVTCSTAGMPWHNMAASAVVDPLFMNTSWDFCMQSFIQSITRSISTASSIDCGRLVVFWSGSKDPGARPHGCPHCHMCRTACCLIVPSFCTVFWWSSKFMHRSEVKFLSCESYSWPVRSVLIVIAAGFSSVELHNGIHHTPWVLVCRDTQAIRGLQAFPTGGKQRWCIITVSPETMLNDAVKT